MAERAVKMAGVSGVVEQLVLHMSSTLGIPIVFDPDTSYENSVKLYRSQVEEKYQSQGFDNETTTPTIVGWRRSPLRRGRFGRRSSHDNCVPQIDRQGDRTGGTVRFAELQGEFDLDFTIYTVDMDVIEDFEIQYLSGYSIRKYKHVEMTMQDTEETGKSFVDFTNSSWSLAVTWDDELGEITFERSDSQYISINFRAKVSGPFFSRIDGGTTPRYIYKVVHENIIS